MKKIEIVFLSFFMGIFLFACSSNNQQSADEHHEDAHHEHIHHHDDEDHEHEHHAEDNEAIELNDGEKWVINQEMKPFIDNEQKLINEYIRQEDKDYKALADKLDQENKSLIKSCTMNGKAHEELHKWLHPHLELIKKLKETDDEHIAEHIVGELKASFSNFEKYFQ
ncbi:MAG: hypothetical protein M9887_12375 [Chitinophagales bacterium]|nr:hypothetical protein [Chitinophagales bacterium]